MLDKTLPNTPNNVPLMVENKIITKVYRIHGKHQLQFHSSGNRASIRSIVLLMLNAVFPWLLMCKCTADWLQRKWCVNECWKSALNRCRWPDVFLHRQLMDLIKHTGGCLMTLHTARDAANASDVLKWVRGTRGTEQPVRLPWPSAFSQLRSSPHPTRPRPPPRSSRGNESSSPPAQPASAASARPPALYSAGSLPAPAHAKNPHNKDELLSVTSFLCSHQVCFGHHSSVFVWRLTARCEKEKTAISTFQKKGFTIWGKILKLQNILGLGIYSLRPHKGELRKS